MGKVSNDQRGNGAGIQKDGIRLAGESGANCGINEYNNSQDNKRRTGVDGMEESSGKKGGHSAGATNARPMTVSMATIGRPKHQQRSIIGAERSGHL